MRRLCLLVVLCGGPFLLRAADGPRRKAGDLYFVAIGQQENWRFLPEGSGTFSDASATPTSCH